MAGIEWGICCPGCPHRAAYVVCKEALGRGKGRVICGDAGCAAVGPMHPAATACPGGEEALLPRYRQAIPAGTAGEPGSGRCVHFVPGAEILAVDAAERFASLASEGSSTVLAVLASDRAFLSREAIEELGARALSLGAEDAAVVDPFDTLRAEQIVGDMLECPGLHAVVFASPCARLVAGGSAGTGSDTLEPAEIDRYACVGCHRCKQITGCPALMFAPPAYRIDADACTGCDLCVGFCRTHVIYTPRSRLAPEERSARRYAAAQR